VIVRDGVAQPDPDPAVIEVLRDHQWNDLAVGCACGWSQRESLGRGARRSARINHPVHVAAAIAAIKAS
jgi:hypothetical protein